MRLPRNFTLPTVRRAWARELLDLGSDDEAFSEKAQELFFWQWGRVAPYRRLARSRGLTPEKLVTWRDLPAAPQALFKRARLFSGTTGLSPGQTYRTSGTTLGQPGQQHLCATEIYRAVAVAGARRVGLLARPIQLHFLAPSPTEAPSSSLSAMFGFWADSLRQHDRFWITGAEVDWAGLRRALDRQIAWGQPIGLAGTAFAFVHLLDAWPNKSFLAFPPGSWLLETGGFKGRSREVPKPELYRALTAAFGVSEERIWNEYGMSELSSQAYLAGVTGDHAVPNWARVLVVDPVTGREVRRGQQGLVRWIDLANTDSVLALQTLDLAERTSTGFRLLGRLPRTEPRGCSLGLEDLLAGAARVVAP